jgi:lipopolysaccharide export system permease protein
MLFHSSLRRELSRSFGATFVVLITVVMSMMLIRIVGLAAKGSIDPQDVMLLMGYAVLGHLSTILTLSLFIAVSSTLGRMYRDSEMAIWFSSGRGLASFTAPVLRFAWPILLGIVVLALFVWPWSNQQSQQLKERYELRGDLDRVAAGQFQENASGSRVFFIERNDKPASPGEAHSASNGATDDVANDAATDQAANNAAANAAANAANIATSAQTPTASSTISTSATTGNSSPTPRVGRNVFILSTEQGKQAVTSARSGRMEREGDKQLFVLNNGQRMEQVNGEKALKISQFSEYRAIVGQSIANTEDEAPVDTLRSIKLIRDPIPANLGELSWRLGLGIAAFNLVLLALVLSATNPRSGRGYSLMFSLLAFVVYYNLLNIGASWLGGARVGFAPFMLSLHGSVLVATLLWLAYRHNQWSWRHLLTLRSPANAL